MNKKEKYFTLLSQYKKKLEDINLTLENFSYTTVFNSQLEKQGKVLDSIKAIVVMDNPGITELEQGKFLIGAAGKGFNKVMTSLGISREELIVLNKSSIHTKATADLSQLYLDETLKSHFLEEQEFTFNFIKQLQDLLGVPLFVHGYSAYLKGEKRFIENEKGGRPLYIFFKNLYEQFQEKKEKVLFYHHSSYGSLEKQVRSFEEETSKKRSFELFIELGKKNRKDFF